QVSPGCSSGRPSCTGTIVRGSNFSLHGVSSTVAGPRACSTPSRTSGRRRKASTARRRYASRGRLPCAGAIPRACAISTPFGVCRNTGGPRGGAGNVAPSVPARLAGGGADTARAQRSSSDGGQPARRSSRRSERLVPDSRAARGGCAARRSLRCRGGAVPGAGRIWNRAGGRTRVDRALPPRGDALGASLLAQHVFDLTGRRDDVVDVAGQRTGLLR